MDAKLSAAAAGHTTAAGITTAADDVVGNAAANRTDETATTADAPASAVDLATTILSLEVVMTLAPGKDQVKRCQTCVHKRKAQIDGHISCNCPDNAMRGRLNAVSAGWWMYPWSFDPMWAITACQNYTSLEG